MKLIDFPICFVAVAVAGGIVWAFGCSVPVVVIAFVAMAAAFGIGHMLFGEGPDVRQRRASNASIRLRNAQRAEYQAAGGQGEPPNLAPRIEPPAPPNYAMGLVAVLVAAGVVAYILTH